MQAPPPPPALDLARLSEIHIDPTTGENDAETNVSGTTRLGALAGPEDDPKLKPIDPSLLKNVSRNAPCPCGSGKKFKHCHGSF